MKFTLDKNVAGHIATALRVRTELLRTIAGVLSPVSEDERTYQGYEVAATLEAIASEIASNGSITITVGEDLGERRIERRGLGRHDEPPTTRRFYAAVRATAEARPWVDLSTLAGSPDAAEAIARSRGTADLLHISLCEIRVLEIDALPLRPPTEPEGQS